VFADDAMAHELAHAALAIFDWPSEIPAKNGATCVGAGGAVTNE
jgi:hypothetical protein